MKKDPELAAAQYAIYCTHEEKGTQKSAEALAALTSAAESGHATAMYKLARSYTSETGGVAQEDIPDETKWFCAACMNAEGNEEWYDSALSNLQCCCDGILRLVCGIEEEECWDEDDC